MPTALTCLKGGIFIFHVSHLKAFLRHPEFEREVEPPPPVLVEGELEYEVKAIL